MDDPMQKRAHFGLNTLSVVGSLCSIIGLCMYIADRYTGLPEVPRLTRLSIVIQLGLLTAIAYGAFWTLVERLFGWSYGAGGRGELPQGWSAVALSLTVTIPLAVMPSVYQAVASQTVLLPRHWRAVPALVLLGLAAHLLMYGTGPKLFRGFSRIIAPPGVTTSLNAGVTRQLVYSAVYFLLIVFPYRVIVQPRSTPLLRDALVGRTTLPALVFVLGMIVFISLRYPASLNEPRSIEVRGVLEGGLLLICLCAGLFV